MKREDIIKELNLYLEEGTNYTISFDAVKSILDILENQSDDTIEVVTDCYNYIWFNCRNCHSHLKANRKEVNFKFDKGYMKAEVKCPCCSINNIITK
jgi:hypothetical protein